MVVVRRLSPALCRFDRVLAESYRTSLGCHGLEALCAHNAGVAKEIALRHAASGDAAPDLSAHRLWRGLRRLCAALDQTENRLVGGVSRAALWSSHRMGMPMFAAAAANMLRNCDTQVCQTFLSFILLC